jgi:two-component system sensor histidine kinase BaeS
MLSGEVGKGVDPVLIDAQRIARVLNNLVSNALRHTPEGGEVRVSARRLEGGVEVEVWDTGEGLSSEDIPHIFERFYRGEKSRSRATGGTGLGLAITKGFIEAHGGEIRVDQGPRGGAQFVFKLPDHNG